MPGTGGTEVALLSAGRVGRGHGLDGSFHVTQPRARLLVLGGTVVIGGVAYEVVRRDGTDARPILRLDGVATRETLDALRGAELWVRREAAPPLGEDEYYAEDLAGCLVVDGEREIGTVKRMLPYPSCELLEVERAGGGPAKDLLVPLINDAVRDIDLVARRIDVDTAFLGEDA
jgi:16S rRNA processing protein RimM